MLFNGRSPVLVTVMVKVRVSFSVTVPDMSSSALLVNTLAVLKDKPARQIGRLVSAAVTSLGCPVAPLVAPLAVNSVTAVDKLMPLTPPLAIGVPVPPLTEMTPPPPPPPGPSFSLPISNWSPPTPPLAVKFTLAAVLVAETTMVPPAPPPPGASLFPPLLAVSKPSCPLTLMVPEPVKLLVTK